MSSIPPMITWMQSLSEPTRARVLRLLDRSELTVADVCSTLQLPQSTVSRHLKVLGDEGWISVRREGTSNWYRMRVSDLVPAQKKLWQVVKAESVMDATAEQDDLRLEQVLEARRSKSEAFFSTAGEKWDRMKSELYGYRLDAWSLAAIADTSTRFGDFGCGTGALSHLVAPWVQKVVAIDSSSSMVNAARKRLRDFSNVEVRQSELSQLPLDDASLSLGLCSLVLSYVAEPAVAVMEMSRTIDAHGKLVLVDLLPHDRAEYREVLRHLWLGFSETMVREWLFSAGWEDVAFYTIPPDTESRGTGLFIATAQTKR